MLTKDTNNQTNRRPASLSTFPSRLTIGRSNDPYEQEANKVADRVVSQDAQYSSASPNPVQGRAKGTLFGSTPTANAVQPQIQKQDDTNVSPDDEFKLKTPTLGDSMGLGQKPAMSLGVPKLKLDPNIMNFDPSTVSGQKLPTPVVPPLYPLPGSVPYVPGPPNLAPGPAPKVPSNPALDALTKMPDRNNWGKIKVPFKLGGFSLTLGKYGNIGPNSSLYGPGGPGEGQPLIPGDPAFWPFDARTAAGMSKYEAKLYDDKWKFQPTLNYDLMYLFRKFAK